MDDVLYTISDAKIKANDLDDLSGISVLELPVEQQNYYGRAGAGGLLMIE